MALLDRLAEDPTPTLRWYRSTTTAIVLGRGQRETLLESRDVGAVDVVGRFSGGGAVLMDDGLLSADIIVPAHHPLAAGDIGAIFERVGAAWAAALGDLGVTGLAVHRGPSGARVRGSPRQRLLAAVCYATLGRGEVVAGGRKLVGLSQRRRAVGALVQCGLLRRWQPAALLEALGADADDPEVLAAAVGLDDLVPDPPDDAAVMAAVERRVVG